MPPQPRASTWVPCRVAGRDSAIAPDPTNASVAYVDGAAGGVWKTTDGGGTWAPKFDTQPSLSMGAIVDPSNTQTVWQGTGEPNASGDSYYGAGIYKSTNGGTSGRGRGRDLPRGLLRLRHRDRHLDHRGGSRS